MRSLLLVPGDRTRELDASLASGADALIIDLTVGPEARQISAGWLAGLERTRSPLLYVKVHDLASGLTDADLDAIMPAGPHGIVLPRTVGATDVQQLGVKLGVREAEHGLADGATRILAVAADSARGLLAIGSVPSASPRLAGIAWDVVALAGDLRVVSARDEDGRWTAPFLQARGMTVIAAVAAGVPAIDCVGADEEYAVARCDGFAGRITRDPRQVAAINAVFS